jgi:hypothetical protein
MLKPKAASDIQYKETIQRTNVTLELSEVSE